MQELGVAMGRFKDKSKFKNPTREIGVWDTQFCDTWNRIKTTTAPFDPGGLKSKGAAAALRGRSGLVLVVVTDETFGAGCNPAFEWLYNSHSKCVYNIFLRILRNTDEAEDLTQQVFLRLFRSISAFHDESAFSTWVHRVTVNTALTFLRRKKSTAATNDNSDGAGAVLSFVLKLNQ